ncbi:uncharacterized protein LOC133816233 [Humulus lupulus]|uniref:uncharacterized protein LOC133816233 n=1 Tax=Humulus lupulus TaxID=3486 RepID=UPI002B40924E|nr:uncharacterized protein LOC133816233 [Humulus lupulus]
MSNWAQENSPSSNEVNPKEQCQAVTLRSGTKYEGPTIQEKVEKPQDQKVVTSEQEKVPEGALEQMPSYVKFMKDILSKKRKVEDYETITLIEDCIAILQRKLPQKLRDLGSFTIPCTIDNFQCERALCYLGANFIVLDMEEDEDVPVILRRPLLATGQALIDVQKRELALMIQGEEVVFNVFKALTYPRASDSCCSVNVLDEECSKGKPTKDPLELSLISSLEECDGTEAIEYVKWLNAAGQIHKRKYE